MEILIILGAIALITYLAFLLSAKSEVSNINHKMELFWQNIEIPYQKNDFCAIRHCTEHFDVWLKSLNLKTSPGRKSFNEANCILLEVNNNISTIENK